MDLATIIGIIATFGLIIGSILVGGSLTNFVDVPSLMIVVGGTFGVVLMNFPFAQVLGSFKVAIHALRFRAPEIMEQNALLVRFAESSRREGILSLESELNNISDAFLQRGLQLLIDGIDPDKLETMLEDELAALQARHAQGAQFFDVMGGTAPALGLIGTLIGLVLMLQSMDDPSTIGPSMAVALLTTFYGAIISTCVAMPVANKLRVRNNEEAQSKQLIIKGLMGIARGENPRLLMQSLQVELAPKLRGTAESGG